MRAGIRALARSATVGDPSGVPPVSDAAHAAGLVDVRTVVPDAFIDLRYATSNNFTHTQLYPADARCLVHQSMAPGLAAAANSLRPEGQILVSGIATTRLPTSPNGSAYGGCVTYTR